MLQKLSTYRRGNTTTTGISTSSNLVIGTDTSTGTADQNLQVSGGTYISGNTGIGSDVPQAKLDVDGNTRIVGILTVGTASSTITTTIDGSQDFPIIRPTLDLNFAATKTLDRRITFTRDSLGTFTDDMGIVRYASNNVPRFDHDPTTGESLGLLVEESRQNLLEYSEDISQWSSTTGGSPTITPNADTAPDGTNTATLIENTGVTAYMGDATLYTSGTTYTFSGYFKANDGDQVAILLYSAGAASGFWNSETFNVATNFDLTNGTFTTSSGAVAPTTSTITDAGNGWWRCSITATATSNSSGSNQLIRNVSGVTEGIYAWGYQIEAGAFPTSYIPTSGSTVTRAADFAKITGTNFTDFYNQSEGTIFSQHSLMDGVDNNNNCYVYQVDNGTNNEVAFRLIDKNTFYSNPSKLTATTLNSATSTTLLQKSSVSSDTTLHSTSYAVKTDDFAVTFDGATVQTDNSGSLPNNQTTLSIGYNLPANTAQLNGHIKQLTYYNKRLTNSQLQSLTRQ